MHIMSVCSGEISKQHNKLTKIQIKDVAHLSEVHGTLH